MTDQYHVYAHFTKTQPSELFYIGCGRKGRVSLSCKGRNKLWHEIVNKHGFESEIIISFDNREEALAEELRLQIVNKPRACIVYGESKIIPKETRVKLSESMKGNTYALGFKHTLETRKKVSDSLKGNTRALGHKHTTEHIKKYSEAHKKPVVNCRGEIFSFIGEATSCFSLKDNSSIGHCLSHKQKTAGKYPDGSKVNWSFYTPKEKE